MAQFACLLGRQQLALWRLASTDPYRLSLGAIHLEGDLVVATDGYILGTLRAPMTPPDEFPQRVGLPDSLPVPPEGVLIPTSAVRAALKSLPKRGHLTVLQNAALWIGESTASLYTTDLDSWQEHSWRRDTYTPFPNWRGVWPMGDDAKQPEGPRVVAFNTPLLATLDALCRDLAGKAPCYSLAFEVRAGSVGARFSFQTYDADLRGTLMPMLVDETTRAPQFAAPEVTADAPTTP